MKILNLYAGIGGNRKLWGNEHEITSVELIPEIAEFYQETYPQDTVIIGDAHDYLLNHYQEFDFIWSSPPCPSHGQYRYNVGVKAKGFKAVYPDLKLYEEIIFLKHYFQGAWVVENVIPYYDYLIKPTTVIQRHPFWSNYPIPYVSFPKDNIRSKNKISDYQDIADISHTRIKNKRQVLRNCVNPELGLHVFRASWNSYSFSQLSF